ncbi:MAG: class D sortase [Acidobacteriota bacterium]
MRIPAAGLRVLERAAFAAGAVLIGWVAWQLAAAQWYQHVEGRRLERWLAQPAAPTALVDPAFHARLARAASARHEPVGRLRIPRLGLSAVVAEGADEAILARAVGHLPRTAFPGERGNTVLAAHRDSFFRHLARLRRGDLIEIDTADGRFRYRVQGSSVVGPDHVEVSAATRDATLTLITCYPFEFIGPAPLRFVVRASLLPSRLAVSTG